MKNKLSFLLLAFLFSFVALQAQTKETRNVETFTKVAFRVAGKCYLRQGSPQKVEVEGSKEALEKITIEVTDGRLVIGTDKRWNNWNWRNSDQIKVYVTVKDIDAVTVSGSGDLVAETKLTGNDFKITVSGSGSMEAEVDASGNIDANVSGSGGLKLKGKCRNLESDVSGSGDVDLSATIADVADFGLSGSGKIRANGSARKVKATISGSGEVLAADLQSDECEVRISGSGDVEISVKSSLDASISGSGSVSYRGNPSHVNSHAAGSGHVRKM